MDTTSSPDADTFFDLDDVPELFESSSPHSQEDVAAILRARLRDLTPAQEFFETAHPEDVPLSEYERIYNSRGVVQALHSLQNHRRPIFNSNHIYQSTDPNIGWGTGQSYVDALVLVPTDPGFDVLLPSLDPGPAFAFQIDFSSRGRLFSTKYAELGFTPHRSMMHIGYVAEENVWLALRPNNLDAAVPAEALPKKGSRHDKDTIMPIALQHMLILCFAYMLGRASVQNVYIRRRSQYPDDIQLWDTVVAACNLFRENTAGRRKLSLADLKSLNTVFKEEWADWLESAPASWRALIGDRSPCAISCRVGQNYPLALSSLQGIGVAQDQWCGNRDMTKIRFISIALATDIVAIPYADDIDPIELDSAEIWEKWQGRIFNHWNPTTRDQFTEAEFVALAHHDATTSQPIHIYNAHGYRIPRTRRTARSARCAVLANLPSIHSFYQDFEPVEFDDITMDPFWHDMPSNPSPKLHLYPQAFMANMGNYQANSVPASFQTHVARLNHSLGDPFTTSRQSTFHSNIPQLLHNYTAEYNPELNHPFHLALDDAVNLDNDPDFSHPDHPPTFDAVSESATPIRGFASQGYNSVSHRIRWRAWTHDAQLGDMTAAVAGLFAATAADRSKAKHALNRLDIGKPFERLADLLATPSLNRSFRAENVFVIDVHQLKRRYRSTRALFHKVIRVLCRYWAHPLVMNSIKPHLIVVDPRVFPNMYLWTSYPLACAMDVIWSMLVDYVTRSVYPPANTPERPPPPPLSCCYLIEMMSFLERVANYGQTGNARVLVRTAMDPFYLALSVLHTAMPMWSNLVSIRPAPDQKRIISIREAYWPIELHSQYTPASSAFATIKYCYGLEYAQQYHATFMVHHVAHYGKLSTGLTSSVSNASRAELVTIVLDATINIFIQELFTFVSKSIATLIKASSASPSSHREDQLIAQERLTAFNDWKNEEYPFSDSTAVLRNLIIALQGPATVFQGLPKSDTPSISYDTLAKSMLLHAKPGTTRPPIKAPFQSASRFLIVLKVAFRYLDRPLLVLSGNHPDRLDSTFVAYTCNVLRARRIHFLPWHANPIPGQAGAPPSKLCIQAWITLTTDLRGFLDVPPDNTQTPTSQQLTVVVQSIQNTRPDRPWSITALHVSDFASIAARTVPPTELDYTSNPTGGTRLAPNSLVARHYVWCLQHARFSNSMHRLFAYIAALVAALAPYIFIDPAAFLTFPNVTSPAHVTRVLQTVPVFKKADRGATAPAPIFLSVIAMLLGIYEPVSPLGTHRTANAGAFGKEWSQRHSQKGIHISLLVRFGAMEASEFPNSRGKIKDGSFRAFQSSVLEGKCLTFDRILADGLPFSEFRAVATLCGPLLARRIAIKMGYACPLQNAPVQDTMLVDLDED
ncbi:hypothetical protein BDW22DRAFT_1433298 [Trametopsis cervina]|nr:hypothetical protein BDW22DRAFT_1433298 [Trametopsis cervina]